VVVDPEVFAELEGSHEALEELRSILPLLLAALSTGAALPSDTLRRLGVNLADDSWQTLNELQHRSRCLSATAKMANESHAAH
jgi:hypothetical protein